MSETSKAYGPHPAAVEHAEKRERSYARFGGYEPSARQYIEDAHDPALRLEERSIRGGAVLDWIARTFSDPYGRSVYTEDFRRAFGGDDA